MMDEFGLWVQFLTSRLFRRVLESFGKLMFQRPASGCSGVAMRLAIAHPIHNAGMQYGIFRR